jgi:hypothetical protein
MVQMCMLLALAVVGLFLCRLEQRAQALAMIALRIKRRFPGKSALPKTKRENNMKTD